MTTTRDPEIVELPESAAPSPRRPFPVGPLLILLAVVLVVTGCVAEIALRIGAARESRAVEAQCSAGSLSLGSQKGLFVLDPVAGYAMQPNVCVRLKTSEYDQVLVTNSRGEVGPEVPPAKQSGEYRIVVLGDSYTAGGQVPYDQNFTAVLEQQLRSAGYSSVRVINAGVGGQTTYNELGILKENIDWMQPDLVIVAAFLGNDVGENVMATAGGYRVVPAHPKGVTWGTDAAKLLDESGTWFPRNNLPSTDVPPPWDPSTGLPEPVGNVDTSTELYPPPASLPTPSFKTQVHLALEGAWDGVRTRSLLLGRLFGVPIDPSVSTAPGERPVTTVQSKLNLSSFEWTALRDQPHTYWLDVAWPLFGEYLGQVQQLAGSVGAKTMLLSIPEIHQFDDQRQSQDMQSFRFTPDEVDWTRPQRDLQAQANAHGIPMLDLLPLYQARPDKGQLYLTIDEHFSMLGHQVTAQALASYLEQSGWLPSRTSTAAS
jgi:lysophospholipase L1-like esterase